MMQREPRVVMASLWRNDAARLLTDRVAHLLGKSYPNLRWLWLVGDSVDDTLTQLQAEAARQAGVTVERYDTGIVGNDMATRLRRLSAMANALLVRVRMDDEYVLIHESDLVSPVDVVERLVDHARAGRSCVAGWPVIRLNGRELFYDIFLYRRDGVHFTNTAPYHACYRPDEPFEVDSFGSVYMFPADVVREGIVGLQEAAVGICAHVRRQGLSLWVDPTLRVEQPVSLWEAR